VCKLTGVGKAVRGTADRMLTCRHSGVEVVDTTTVRQLRTTARTSVTVVVVDVVASLQHHSTLHCCFPLQQQTSVATYLHPLHLNKLNSRIIGLKFSS